jgi:hypothetical protein
MKAKFLAVCLAVALAAISSLMVSTSNAATINWALSGVTFDDGGTASGTFSTDSTSGSVLAFNISTTAGSTLSSFVYDSSTSALAENHFSSNSFILGNLVTTDRYLNLAFVNPLSTPGFNLLVLDGSWECANCIPVKFATAGAVINVAETPLPAAFPLLATGLAALGLLARRRRKQPA